MKSFTTLSTASSSPLKKRGHSPKAVIGATMGRSVSSASTVSRKKDATKDFKHNVPFAERQAKSKVAAREILKSGAKMEFRDYAHKTDSLINKSIADLEK
jgi:hypothetical protein